MTAPSYRPALADSDGAGGTVADHVCRWCGKRWTACDCPEAPAAVRCRACGLLVDLGGMSRLEAAQEAAGVETIGCFDCQREGRTLDGDDTPAEFGNVER